MLNLNIIFLKLIFYFNFLVSRRAWKTIVNIYCLRDILGIAYDALDNLDVQVN
jgi:hypothetical protein